MAWTFPPLYAATLQTVTAFNTYIRANLLALKDPPGDVAYVSARNYALDASGSWSNVDTGDVNGHFLQQITTTDDANVVARFMGQLQLQNNNAQIGFGISVDGVQYFPTSGMGVLRGGGVTNISATVFPVDHTFVLTGQVAGTHSYRLTWFGTHAITTLLSTAGYVSQFAVKEMP